MADKLSMIVTIDEAAGGGKSILGAAPTAKTREIDVDLLGANIKNQTEMLMKALEKVEASGGWHMAEVEISAEITAECGVSFIASTKANVGGAIKLKFSRK